MDFCQKHGLALSTLARYQRRRQQEQSEDDRPGRCVAVELAGAHPACASSLAVVLVGGRRIEVGRGRDGPKQFLGQFEGTLQTDGYVAYDQVGGPKMVHACCWAHARRHFFDALKLNPADLTALAIVRRMDELFGVDAEARARSLDHAARHALRREHTKPLLELLKPQIEAVGAHALPSSALGKAATYTLALWPRLTRFLDHPELELSNNLAENSMRPIALGRKNWIHVGSPEAGPKVAAILSVVETCRRMNIPTRDYLAAVLPGLAHTSIQKLAQLTPAAWGTRNR